MIELDVETTGLQWPYHEPFSFQFFDGEKAELIWRDDLGWRERVQHWLDRGAEEGIRAWNSCFDLHFSEADGFTLPPQNMWHDGMIEAHAIDERRSVALKAVGDSLGFSEGADLQKQVKTWLANERKRRKDVAKDEGTELEEPNYSDVPRELMAEYGMEDVFLTRKVCDHQAVLLDKVPELREVVEFERQVMGALYDVEKRGFPVDAEGYRKLEIELIENLEVMDDRLKSLASVGIDPKHVESGGWEFNPKSSKQIYEALKRRGADLEFVTGESMDRENLETVEDELAQAVLDFRSEFKVLSTYVRPMIGRSYETSIRAWKEPFIAPDGCIHANYRQLGARTGRMSCSDPNIQNQPRDDLRLRYNFRALPGYKLVTCDLNSVEMAVFAAYAGEGRLLEAVRSGEDIHAMTAEFVGIRDRARAGGHIESARQRGKTFGFAIIYGAGVRSIRKMMRCNQAEARLYLRRYHDAYPEVARLQARVEWRLEDTGYIKSSWGRRFRLESRDAYRAVNYLVQGTAADLLKASLIRLHAEGVPIVACVHDELIAMVPEEQAEATRTQIIAALTEHPRLTDKVPLTADGDIVDRWSQAKNPLFVPRWAS